MPSPSSGPSSTLATPSSSSLPSSTAPRTSRFRSFSSPTDASFASSSRDAATVHMSTNHQLTGSHISGISTANISSGRRKKTSNQERPQNEVDPFPVASCTAESEKARLRRALEEQDRAHTEIQDNRPRPLSTHVYRTPQTFLERGIHANVQYELGLHIVHGMLRPTSK